MNRKGRKGRKAKDGNAAAVILRLRYSEGSGLITQMLRSTSA